MVAEGGELCFPQLLNSSCRKPEPPRSDTVLINVALSSIALLTAALNLLVIISISHFRHITFTAYTLLLMILVLVFTVMILSHYRQLHTPTNFFLLSLAVSDFLVGFLLIPLEIVLTETCWILGDLMCALYYLLPIIITSASVGNMVLISVDRYIAICDPLRYSVKVTKQIAALCVFLCWVCSFFYAVFLLYDDLKQPGRYNSCVGECVISITGAIDIVVLFIIPITVIIVLYTRVFVVAVSQARAIKSNISLERSKTVKVKRSEIKAARTLGILVVVFLICYSPYYCVSFAGDDIIVGTSSKVFMVFLAYCNSCLNPVIYAIFYPWFKKAIRLIVTFQIMHPSSRNTNIL